MSVLVKEGLGWRPAEGMAGRDGLNEGSPERDRASAKGQKWGHRTCSGDSKSFLCVWNGVLGAGHTSVNGYILA